MTVPTLLSLFWGVACGLWFNSLRQVIAASIAGAIVIDLVVWVAER